MIKASAIIILSLLGVRCKNTPCRGADESLFKIQSSADEIRVKGGLSPSDWLTRRRENALSIIFASQSSRPSENFPTAVAPPLRNNRNRGDKFTHLSVSVETQHPQLNSKMRALRGAACRLDSEKMLITESALAIFPAREKRVDGEEFL